MAKLEIKDAKGKVVGSHEFGAGIASVQPLTHLIHQAVVTEEANSRQGTQKAKTRSEARGGGRKPYKQKKTGNARQGSIRAPHYAHGAMAFAVAPRDYTKKMNRKERRIAIVGALNAQITAGNVLVTDKISFAQPKTKDAATLLSQFGLTDVRRVLVIMETYDASTYKSFANLPNVVVRTAPARGEDAHSVAFSARDLLIAHKILTTGIVLKAIEAIWGGSEATAESVKEEKPKRAPKAAAKAEEEGAPVEKPKRVTKKKTGDEA